MAAKIPEDSILKRHYVAEITGEILADMPPRPTDSVLRRHFEADVAARLEARMGVAPAGATVEAAADGTPSRAPARTAPAGRTERKEGGGLFGWLKRLLGG